MIRDSAFDTHPSRSNRHVSHLWHAKENIFDIQIIIATGLQHKILSMLLLWILGRAASDKTPMHEL